MTRHESNGRVALVAAGVAVFLWMVRSLLVPLILAAVFALLLSPLCKGLRRRLGRLGRLAPAVTTLALLVLVILPLSIVAAKAVTSITGFLTELEPGEVSEVQTSLVGKVTEWAGEVGIPMDRIRSGGRQALQKAGEGVATFLRGLASSVPNAIIDVFLFVLALYFFQRDGQRLGHDLALLSPFDEQETQSLFASVVGTIRGAILGTLAVAFVQGLLISIAFLLFHVPGAALFGVIGAFLSLIPLVGTLPVTGGGVVYLLATGRIGAAIGLAVVGAVVIGTSDNVVRPWVQSSGGKLHPLMAMLGIFGGLATLGPAGIFIGPVVAALVLWLIGYVTKRRHAQVTPRIETE